MLTTAYHVTLNGPLSKCCHLDLVVVSRSCWRRQLESIQLVTPTSDTPGDLEALELASPNALDGHSSVESLSEFLS